MPRDRAGPRWRLVAFGYRATGSCSTKSVLARAGEVVDAFAAHVAEVLGAVAEERPLRPAPLPAVVAEVLTPAADPAPVLAPAPAEEPAPAAAPAAVVDPPLAAR
jgi:hypothetical protein